MSATQSGAEAPAITALGDLFKVTEVFLWDDAVVSFSGASVYHDALAEEPTSSCTMADANSSLKQTIDDYTSVEDLELAQQMNALGLPISFSTAREKRNGATRGIKKGTQLKSVSAGKDIENRVPGVGEWEDVTSSRVFHDSTNMLACCSTKEGQSAASHDEFEEEHNKGDVHSDGESVSALTTILSETGKEQICDKLTDLITSSYVFEETVPDGIDLEMNAEILENPINLDAENCQSCPGNVEDASSGLYEEWNLSNKQKEDKYLEGSSISSHITGAKNDGVDITTLQPCVSSVESSVFCALVNNHIQEYSDNSVCYEFGDWRVVRDAFYMRNYFYNFRTEESTWYPPPGLEHFAFACSTFNSKDLADEAKEDADTGIACDAIPDQDAHSLQDRTDSFWENEYNVEYIDQLSKEISSMMDHATGISTSGANRLSANILAEPLDKHAVVKEVSDERTPPLSSVVKDHAIDELDAREYLDKQEESVTCCDAWNLPDIPLDVPINNSLTRTLNEVGCNENWRSDLPETNMTSMVDELDNHHDISTLKKKKRARRLQSHKKISSATESEHSSGVIGGVSANILKYWCQRYLLFSRFDNGIKMDEEGWFSVTPERIARHHASRCGRGTVIDCFTGVGGNAIQFAVRSNHVIAIDIDRQKIDYAQHNAAIYGVNERIDFIKGDFFQMASCLKGDTVFMSPPWGGPDYAKVETYDITSMLKPHDGCSLFKIGRMIASRVVMFLPRNVDLNQLAELSLSVNPPWALEIEKNFLNGRLKAITAYFSSRTM